MTNLFSLSYSSVCRVAAFALPGLRKVEISKSYANICRPAQAQPAGQFLKIALDQKDEALFTEGFYRTIAKINA